jgi:arabinofuranosyltransferase
MRTIAGRPAPKSWIWTYAPVVGLVPVAFISFLVALSGNIDDAFILLVYLRHLRDSGSVYYNVGGGHVDGFTSTLDFLVKTAIATGTGADPLAVVWSTTLFFHLAVVVAAYVLAVRICRSVGHRQAITLVISITYATLLAASSPLADGSAFLLETPLYVLLCLAGVSFLLLDFTKIRWWRGMLITTVLATSLARPEGIPIGGAICILALVLNRERISRTDVLVIAGAVLTFLVAYHAARVVYFGYWAPNTYYAKLSSSRLNEIRDGLDYVERFWRSPQGIELVVFSIAPVACILGPWRSSRLRVACFAVWAIAVLALGVVVYSGGDGYDGGRFLAAPVALAGTGALVAVVGMGTRTAIGGLVLVAALASLELMNVARGRTASSIWYQITHDIPPSSESWVCDREIARRLEQVSQGGVIAQSDYQRLKYFSDHSRVLDLTGINNREIAHREDSRQVLWGKTDFHEAVKLRPELLIFGYRYFQETPMTSYPLRDVVSDLELSERYFGPGVPPNEADAVSAVYAAASFPACWGYFNFLVRRDLAARAVQVGLIVEKE